MTNPKEIDAQIAALHGKLQGPLNEIRFLIGRIHAMEVKGKPANLPGLQENLAKARAEQAAILAEIAPLDAIFRAERWSRFFVVQAGHVHSSMACATCYPTTVFGWLPELSGDTEAVAVEAWGERMCTVCFPSAPVNPYYHRAAKVDRDAQAAKDQERAEKAEKKAARAAQSAHRETVAQATEGMILKRFHEISGHPANDFAKKAIAKGAEAAALLIANGMTEAELTKKARAKWNREGYAQDRTRWDHETQTTVTVSKGSKF